MESKDTIFCIVSLVSQNMHLIYCGALLCSFLAVCQLLFKTVFFSLLVYFSCSQFCRVTLSLSSQNTLASADQEQKHLVISITQIDLVMPPANGPEFCLRYLCLLKTPKTSLFSKKSNFFLLIWILMNPF